MANWRALDNIMREIGIPNQFIQWVMLGVTTVSYMFNIMGEYTSILQAQRGIGQGDPISPFLFLLIMEYLTRLMQKMQLDPNFNHHAKCEKVKLTNLTFVDDILLFCRGDEISVQMMLETMNKFSTSTGMVMNSNKCKIYFEELNTNDKTELKKLSGFQEGEYPFRYLGVPLTTKKLNINYYLPLIDRIVAHIHH